MSNAAKRRKRWMKAIIAEAKSEVPAAPWTCGARRAEMIARRKTVKAA